jgi:hypothetical protein
MPPMRALLSCAVVGLIVTAGACAPVATLQSATFLDVATVKSQASDWRGPRQGTTYLQRRYEVQIGLATRPSQAISRLRAHVIRVNWDAESPAVLPIATPSGARLLSVNARVIGANGVRSVTTSRKGADANGPVPDPDQALWALTFPPVPAGEALEVIADFELPGTLATDARWLGAVDGPTGQLLIRYDVPKGAKATMQVRGASARPVLTRQDGKQVFAVFMSDVPPRGAGSAHVRYVTLSASVRGYDQTFASTWSRMSGPYTDALVEGSSALRMNHKPPFLPQTPDLSGAQSAYTWARDRLQRSDALTARWSQGRPLPKRVTTNDLNATDKLHLLRWLLDAANIPHQVAAVRSNRFAPMDAGLPLPGAFDGGLIYLPEAKLWLDPACQACQPGEVRKSYRGALAIILPAKPGATLTKLPE